MSSFVNLAQLLLIFLTVVVTTSNSQQQGQTPEPQKIKYDPKTVLAFGGNGFIGSHVVHRMIERGYKIFLVSRGNWYYDSEERIKPHIHQIVCDRENSDVEYCTELVKVLKETPFFDYVLDFSAYRPEVISDLIEYLEGKIGVYMYISSDSVYEVSAPGIPGAKAKETDAFRPSEEEDRERLNELDNYGDEKLQGEEVLVENREKGGFNYLIFRLPDVIGPRDTTERWWTYQMWVQFYDFIKVPLFVPPEVQTLRTSFVFVEDVASAILLALDKGSQVWNQVYNLGLDRDFTLHEFLQDLSNAVGVKIDYEFREREKGFNLFPSVTRGAVDISKAKQVLGFQPTDWQDVLKKTVEFYTEGFYRFKSERDDVIHQITKIVLPRERKGAFLQMIDQLDKHTLHTTKTEL